MDKDLFRDLTYGMFILSSSYLKRDVGCFVNTVVQITSNEPTIAVSINKENYTNQALMESKTFAVAILSEKTNKDVISKFGFYTSKDVDKFEGFKTLSNNNIKIIDENICGYMICEVISITSVDTHNVFVAKVLEAVKLNDLTPMTYSYYHKFIKGTTPKTAPTFIEEKVEASVAGYKKYKCIICGHIYDEEKEGVKFEDLANDWTCPVCGVGKDCFKEI